MFLSNLSSLLLLLQETSGEGGGTPEEQAPSGLFSNPLVPMVVVLAIFWVVMIAPERKKRKARQQMLSELQKGAKVMTSSGMYGTVIQIQEDVVTVQVADNVRIKFARAAIQGLVEAGEEKGDAKTE